MQKNVVRFFSGLLAIVILSVMIVPASADFGGGTGRSDFFTWADGFGGGSFGGGSGRDQSKAAYDDYVQTLPAPAYSSGNELRWRLNISSYAESSSASVISFVGGSSFEVRYLAPSWTTSYPILSIGVDEFKAPVSGDYHLGCWFSGPSSFYGNIVRVGSRSNLFSPASKLAATNGYLKRGEYYEFSTVLGFVAGQTVVGKTAFDFECPAITCQAISGYIDVICTPSVAPSGDIYNTNTRPGSLVGLYGDVNGEAFSNNSATIINETNNTFYNPATGQTVPIVNWSYDYSDRSYKVTLESGDTATITYGDENITISQITTTEGDTITNNYTIYYLIDGTGSVTPPCEHDWQEASGTDPTCTLPGKVTLSCTKCQQTKTETLPALGHDWQLKRTVTTEYDDTGQLIQQGYTIFECSRCKEQYKSTDGAIPPGGGSGTDPGGEDKETIWDKLGNLIGSVLGGLIGMVEAVLGKILDALTALADMLMEKLKTVVETILSIFDELPLLFGGFLDFLAALFPFLPPELMTILTFGILAVVFIGIIKAVRR